MKLPKTLYVKVEDGADGEWLTCSADKDSLVEQQDEVVATYQLVKKEKARTHFEYSKTGRG